jgi:hypothetical protein
MFSEPKSSPAYPPVLPVTHRKPGLQQCGALPTILSCRGTMALSRSLCPAEFNRLDYFSTDLGLDEEWARGGRPLSIPSSPISPAPCCLRKSSWHCRLSLALAHWPLSPSVLHPSDDQCPKLCLPQSSICALASLGFGLCWTHFLLFLCPLYDCLWSPPPPASSASAFQEAPSP